MTFYKVFKSGDEVRAKSEKKIIISKVCEITGENSFTVFWQPETAAAELGEQYSVICITDRGLYVFRAVVVGLRESTPEVELKAVGNYSIMQRRSNFRVKENLPARALMITNDTSQFWVDTTTADISESGVLLRFSRRCAEGQLMKLVIHINKFGMDVVLPTISGRVARCIGTKNKDFSYLLGIKFEDLPERARNEIIRFVVLSQRSWLNYSHAKRYRKDG